MLVSDIKSRPLYSRLRFDPAGQRHLVISDAVRPLGDVIDGVEDTQAPIAFWTVVGRDDIDSAPNPHPLPTNGAPIETRAFRAASHLFDRLDHRLAQESVGLRLYVMGEEGFIWDVMRRSRAAGLEADECRSMHAGSLSRRVFCVHCKTMNERVTLSIAACTGCGAQMVVRDHFSKRLAAFMGVKADAEVAGELPPIEELFP